MNVEQQLRINFLYEQQLTNLKLQGKRPATIDTYPRAVRRVTHHFDKAPDTHSWSTVRIVHNAKKALYTPNLDPHNSRQTKLTAFQLKRG